MLCPKMSPCVGQIYNYHWFMRYAHSEKAITVSNSMGSKLSAARNLGDDFEEWIRRDFGIAVPQTCGFWVCSARRVSPPRTEEMPPAGPDSSSSTDESITEEAPAATPKSAARPASLAPTAKGAARPVPPPEGSSSPDPSDSRDEFMEAALGSPARMDGADTEPRWRPEPEHPGKGWHKGQKGRRIKCQFCWRPLSHPSGCDQHQWRNLNCLTWQYYLRGGCSWREAEERAYHTKAARENYEPMSENPDARGSGIRRSVLEPPEARPPPPPPPAPERRHRARASDTKATCEVRLEESAKHKKEKNKKEKKAKKGKRAVTPSPSPRPRRHDKRDPPSDPEDERKHRKVPKVTRVDEKTWVVKLR